MLFSEVPTNACCGIVTAWFRSPDFFSAQSSTTLAMASVVLDWAEKKSGDLNQAVTIPQQAFVGTSENNIGFQPGDSITLRDLLYAALVQSDNIAAYTL